MGQPTNARIKTYFLDNIFGVLTLAIVTLLGFMFAQGLGQLQAVRSQVITSDKECATREERVQSLEDEDTRLREELVERITIEGSAIRDSQKASVQALSDKIDKVEEHMLQLLELYGGRDK